jgi:hypothetical protein
MSKTFIERKNEIFEEAIMALRGIVESKGKIPEHLNHKAIDISDLEINFIHPIRYVTTDYVADFDGYHYGFDSFEIDEFLKIVDYLVG